MVTKVNSNSTGLRVALEEAPGVLPESGVVWHQLEPNSYGDFGPQVTTVARSPLRPGRQRQKGTVVDVDAAAAFAADLTYSSLRQLLPGFLFAEWRAKDEDAVTAVSTGDTFGVASGGTDYRANDLVLADGFGDANDGVHLVESSTGTTVVVASALSNDASPAAGARIKRVGHQFAAGDLTVDVTGGVKRLVSAAKTMTELGLMPGEWIYVGGDAAGNQFDEEGNNGFARVLSVGENEVVVDKTEGTWASDAGAGKAVRVFVGDVIRNEPDEDDIVEHSYQLERTLSGAGNEYVIGCYANQLTISMEQAARISVDLAFVGMDGETTADGAEKAGDRPDAPQEDAFNTSSDLSRLVLADGSDDTGLATFVTSFTLTINNGVTPMKALGQIGAIDMNVGEFSVSGELTAYFTDVAQVAAIRNNVDGMAYFAVVKENRGLLFDVPLLALGNGRLNVALNQPVTIPVSLEAGQHGTLGHTLLVTSFDYLPDMAG